MRENTLKKCKLAANILFSSSSFAVVDVDDRWEHCADINDKSDEYFIKLYNIIHSFQFSKK